jgi:hypothetical protein
MFPAKFDFGLRLISSNQFQACAVYQHDVYGNPKIDRKKVADLETLGKTSSIPSGKPCSLFGIPEMSKSQSSQHPRGLRLLIW